MAKRDAGGVVSPVVNTAQASGGDPNAGIVTGTGADWFSPLNPQKPSAPPEVAGRQLDFPAGYNLNVQPRAYDSVKFDELRALADSYDILRLVIETRKDQMARLEWAIKPRKKAKGPAKDEVDPRAEKIEAFFRYPDKVNAWDTWLRMLLEDMFVLDAPAVYMRRTRGGQLYSLEPIDGATIKRVIDAYGRTPVYPVPAYQQTLKGLPAVNYTTKDLLYRPRNARTNKVYGFGPVEQIMLTVNIALRRQIFTLQYFTEGNIPEAFIGVPDTWTPDQIKSFQEWWDSILEGNTGARRHAKFVPGGMDIKQTKDPELTGKLDEWLARVVCYAFSISPQAFVSMMNRATAQTAKEAATEEGLAPTQHWVKQMMDFVIATEFNAPDLEFDWAEEEETNPVDQESVLTGYVKAGGIRLNELRDKLGLEADADPAANTLMVLTPTGYVPIGAYAQQQADAQAATEATLAAATARANEPAAPGNENATSGKVGPADAKTKEVGKIADAPFVKKAIDPVPYPRRATRKAVAATTAIWNAVFKRQVEAFAKGIRATLFKAEMDERSNADDYAQSLDYGLTSSEMSDIVSQFSSVAAQSGDLAFAQIGSDQDVFDQVNEAAQKWASEHAATLVSQISDTTRDAVRQAIADGTANGLSSDEIADNVEELGAFSSARSQLIANTEIANANSQGALVGYRAAAETGIVVLKAWILGDDTDDECADNADAGAIDLDDVFPSGDDAPLAHPNCKCVLIPVVGDEDAE